MVVLESCPDWRLPKTPTEQDSSFSPQFCSLWFVRSVRRILDWQFLLCSRQLVGCRCCLSIVVAVARVRQLMSLRTTTTTAPTVTTTSISTMNTPSTETAVVTALWGLRIFLCIVAAVSLLHGQRLYLEAHGRPHRILGAAQLVWLLVCSFVVVEWKAHLFMDIVSGCLGLASTLSAAHSFPHRHVRNAKGQSGTLSPQAIVTQNEMLEHAFYQGLNLVQVLYLHYTAYFNRWPESSGSNMSMMLGRLVALLVVTSPWWIRSRFPVHSFSANWKQQQQQQQQHGTQSSEVLWLYRIKKWQYVFYKHVILHGINIGVALAPAQDLVHTMAFRCFWLCLNASYVMEFFLQTMVKRQALQQTNMLLLQRLLMASSSLAAVMMAMADGGIVLIPIVCLASVVLNFIHRHHDVLNTMLIGTIGMSILRYS